MHVHCLHRQNTPVTHTHKILYLEATTVEVFGGDGSDEVMVGWITPSLGGVVFTGDGEGVRLRGFGIGLIPC